MYPRAMSNRQPVAGATYDEYLLREALSDVRHEYLRGDVHAMAGGTIEHGAVAAAFTGELHAALRGKPCRAFSSDVRVRVEETDLTTYPDISVVCGPLQTAAVDPNAITNPVVIVEVLSPNTEAYDRGAKAAHYRRLPSLRELVLVSASERRVEVQRRTDSGAWELHEARAGEWAELASLGVTLEVDLFFADPLPPRD